MVADGFSLRALSTCPTIGGLVKYLLVYAGTLPYSLTSETRDEPSQISNFDYISECDAHSKPSFHSPSV